MPVDSIRTDVLIAGAGPTGMTLACALARAGVAFHLIDKQIQRSPYSRALVIHLRSLEILDQLGIAEGLMEQGNEVSGGRIHFRRIPRFSMDLSDQRIPGCRFHRALFLEQDRTEAALDNCLGRLGHKPRFNHELIGFEEREDHIMALCRNDRGREYRVECRYITGCDGAHSLVRDQKRIPFSGSAYEQDFMLADVDIHWDQPKHFFQAFVDPQGFMALLQMRRQIRIVAGRGRYRDDGIEPTLDDFKQLFARLVPYQAELSNPTWIARFHLHHRIARRFRLGRACLAGDAAHIHSPAGGQGMNTGIQDAWNLGWKLAWALRAPRHADTLLDSYHEERFPVGEALLRTTDRAFNLASGTSRLSRFTRAWIAPWLLPMVMKYSPLWLRRSAVYRITQIGINYRHSSLCGPDPDRQHFTKALLPGDRMPDISDNCTPLHRLLDPLLPTVLAAGTSGPIDPAGCKTVHLAHPTEQDREVLGMKRHGLFLIRPDAHLTARALSLEKLMDSRLMQFLSI